MLYVAVLANEGYSVAKYLGNRPMEILVKAAPACKLIRSFCEGGLIEICGLKYYFAGRVAVPPFFAPVEYRGGSLIHRCVMVHRNFGAVLVEAVGVKPSGLP